MRLLWNSYSICSCVILCLFSRLIVFFFHFILNDDYADDNDNDGVTLMRCRRDEVYGSRWRSRGSRLDRAAAA